MSKRKKNIEEFFSVYESNFNRAISGEADDLENEIRRSFSDTFLESSPAGVTIGKNDSSLVDTIRQGLDFYKGIGAKGMNIVSKDITMLDEFHALANIYWRYEYAVDQTEGAVDFHVFYVLSTHNNDIKIVAFLDGDEQKVLKEKGLIKEPEFSNQE